MYGAFLAATAKLLADHDISAPARVLDIGSGTGIWVEFWRGAGAQEVVGVDLTDAAVAGLRGRFPNGTFVQADIGAQSLPVSGAFDVVSAMSVLLHITDEPRFQQAWTNIAGALGSGGYAILIEPVVAHQWWGKPFDENSHSKARPLSAYTDACHLAGLELVDIRPATVLLANPIDARSRLAFRLLFWWWAALEALVRGNEGRGRFVGSVLGRIDAPLRRLLPNGPSAKLLLVRRQ
jgi:SAM-dependent methyltransferase